MKSKETNLFSDCDLETNRSFGLWLFFNFYSFLLEAIYSFSSLFFNFSSAIAYQLSGRRPTTQEILDLCRSRSKKEYSCVFFCSSAGEFEQALPVIKNLETSVDCFVHVFFFSRSGYEFAKTKKIQTSFSLACLDSIWQWGQHFSALRPDIFLIVRHEWWPCFLFSARSWGKVWLIDAVGKAGAPDRGLKARLKRVLVSTFSDVFVVGKVDKQYFEKNLLYPGRRIHVVGDTKYDRALEHTKEGLKNIEEGFLEKLLEVKKSWLICGSVYEEDGIILKAFFEIMKHRAENWSALIVPHTPDENTVSMLISIADEVLNEKSTTWSELTQTTKANIPRVVVVDRLGLLSQLYSLGEAAYVGGGVHNKVHNVLEPAAFGLRICCGPRYTNSSEAIYLHDQRLLEVVKDTKEASSWFLKQTQNTESSKEGLKAALDGMCGASKKITEKIVEYLKTLPACGF